MSKGAKSVWVCKCAALAPLVAVAALAFASSAQAVTDFTSSSITAPADVSFPLFNQDAPNTIHVEGTTAGGDSNADLVCFYGSTRVEVKPDVTVTAGAFSTEMPLMPLGSRLPRPFCTLRAVPANDLTIYPPDGANTFAGARIGVGRVGVSAISSGVNQGLVHDYAIAQGQAEGQTDLRSVGSCGLDYGFIFDPLTLAQSDALFYCNGWLSTGDGCASESATCKGRNRSELIVDGANAYTPSAAQELYTDGVHKSNLLAGFPVLTFSRSIDPVNGDISITETDEVARCSPNATAFHELPNDPGWQTDCTSFAATGVKLDRTIHVDRKGRRTTITDVWSSTDGAAHQLELRYDEDFNGANPPVPTNQYSWIGPAYSSPGFGETIPGPPTETPNTMMVDGNGSVADVFQSPQGAVTYSDSPADVYWYYDDGAGTSAQFRFVRSVPAGGSVTIARSYIAGATKDEVSAQLPEELARLGRPKVAITGPATSVDTSAVLATGTAVDPGGGVTGLTVNGEAVSVGGDGSWTKALTLNEGKNTITATASDANGNTGAATRVITFTPPPAAGPVPVPAAADRTAPVVRLTIAKTRLAALLRKGLPVRVRCFEACRFNLTLASGSKTVGKASGRMTAAGTKKVVIKLFKQAKKRLKRAKRARLTVRAIVRDTAGNTTRKSAKVTIRR